MRLDHLLSREPTCGEHAVIGPVGLVGVLFSCACMCSLPSVGGGCGCVFGLGIKCLCEQTHCRVHVQHRVGVHRLGGGCPHDQPGVLVWVVCGGLFVICIVVASIFVLYCFLCFV